MHTLFIVHRPRGISEDRTRQLRSSTAATLMEGALVVQSANFPASLAVWSEKVFEDTDEYMLVEITGRMVWGHLSAAATEEIQATDFAGEFHSLGVATPFPAAGVHSLIIVYQPGPHRFTNEEERVRLGKDLHAWLMRTTYGYMGLNEYAWAVQSDKSADEILHSMTTDGPFRADDRASVVDLNTRTVATQPLRFSLADFLSLPSISA
jgi:hypothetical protein